MARLRDEIREHFQREADRHPASAGLRQSVISEATTRPEEHRRTAWFAAAVAVFLTLAIVAALVAAGEFRRSSNTPVTRTSPTATPTGVSPSPTPPTTSPSAAPSPAGPSPSAPPAVAAGSGTWTRLPDMAVPRADFTATLLKSHKVLVVGGLTGAGGGPFGGEATNSVEIYDPATRSFTKAASLSVARAGQVASVLEDGRVLVAGGCSSGGALALATAEIYDPSTDAWTTAAPMSLARAQAAAVLMPGGKVLVVGGASSGEAGTGAQPAGTRAELYDPASDTWQAAGNMAIGRPVYPTANLMPDGRVLVVGGRALFNSPDSATEVSEIYDPATNSWSSTPPENRLGARQDQSATLLANGLVLVAGGGPVGQSPSSLADLFDPRTNTWKPAPNMQQARCGQPAVTLPNGNVMLIGGGCGWSDPTTAVEVYNWAGSTWTAVASLAVPVGRSQAVVFGDGTVLDLGGLTVGQFSSAAAELYRP